MEFWAHGILKFTFEQQNQKLFSKMFVLCSPVPSSVLYDGCSLQIRGSYSLQRHQTTAAALEDAASSGVGPGAAAGAAGLGDHKMEAALENALSTLSKSRCDWRPCISHPKLIQWLHIFYLSGLQIQTSNRPDIQTCSKPFRH